MKFVIFSFLVISNISSKFLTKDSPSVRHHKGIQNLDTELNEVIKKYITKEVRVQIILKNSQFTETKDAISNDAVKVNASQVTKLDNGSKNSKVITTLKPSDPSFKFLRYYNYHEDHLRTDKDIKVKFFIKFSKLYATKFRKISKNMQYVIISAMGIMAFIIFMLFVKLIFVVSKKKQKKTFPLLINDKNYCVEEKELNPKDEFIHSE
ncbi:hypothetical protein A3Q56_06236 [Intoshia linei]|uniref:Uncharacterized protein n=1 Tax=Intoshia linei TaxID=1819745 RepID=A0A177AVN3_9BILA|nr:hypothetical protein A3Q56_06236 [Intoshia linei]